METRETRPARSRGDECNAHAKHTEHCGRERRLAQSGRRLVTSKPQGTAAVPSARTLTGPRRSGCTFIMPLTKPVCWREANQRSPRNWKAGKMRRVGEEEEVEEDAERRPKRRAKSTAHLCLAIFGIDALRVENMSSPMERSQKA